MTVKISTLTAVDGIPSSREGVVVGWRQLCSWLCCMCLRVCVCVREREREGETERNRQTDRERERQTDRERERDQRRWTSECAQECIVPSLQVSLLGFTLSV